MTLELDEKSLVVRKPEKKVKEGPLLSKENIPYDYIVIIDAGSKGSRVYIYNWLNPLHILKNGLSLHEVKDNKNFQLVKRLSIRSDGATDDDIDGEHEAKSEKKATTKNPDKKVKVKSKGSTRLPVVGSKNKWKRKIKPGISSFNSSPQKIGNHHVKYLLQLASAVVPKSQHHRTPIFLHSTGGMRLLTPTEQQQILDSICSYITNNSDFYIPECDSHINVIDGSVEGLFGWLSINYLIGALDNPNDHQHGKNHTTYGLLDMGGASTQVVFQPNSTEIEEHENNLFKVSLVEGPIIKSSKTTDDQNTNKNVGIFSKPSPLKFDVYSDSFLGFGMYQAHNRYLSFLINNYNEEHGTKEHLEYYGSIGTPISDPCLPKGYTTKSKMNDMSIDFTGESDFQKCLTSIFPVLLNSTYSAAGDKTNVNCQEFSEGNQVSSCLLNDLIPAFDFDVNHFVGVSGYWDAITSLLAYEKQSPRDGKNKNDKPKDNDSADAYDYKVIYKATSKLCSQTFSDLIDLNKAKPKKKQMSEVELSELCFKSSWILNFLHLGLGFPRFGIDKSSKENNRFKSLQLVEKLGGSSFSWTLGRAILYANDEYAQAFNNYTAENMGFMGEDMNSAEAKKHLITRPGFYHSASSSVFHYGAEQRGIFSRPAFSMPSKNAKYPTFDYETEYQSESTELKWYIEPHRWQGSLIFMILIGFILWLMIGNSRRSHIHDKTRNKIKHISTSVVNLIRNGRLGSGSYFKIRTDDSAIDNNRDLEIASYELDPIERSNSASEGVEQQFIIDSDDE